MLYICMCDYITLHISYNTIHCPTIPIGLINYLNCLWIDHRRRNHGGSWGLVPPLFSETYLMLTYYILDLCLQS